MTLPRRWRRPKSDRFEIANADAPLSDETIRALAAFLLAIVDQEESERLTDNDNGIVAESQAGTLPKPDREASRDTCDSRSHNQLKSEKRL